MPILGKPGYAGAGVARHDEPLQHPIMVYRGTAYQSLTRANYTLRLLLSSSFMHHANYLALLLVIQRIPTWKKLVIFWSRRDLILPLMMRIREIPRGHWVMHYRLKSGNAQHDNILKMGFDVYAWSLTPGWVKVMAEPLLPVHM